MPDNHTRHQFLKVDSDTERSALPPSVLDSAVNLWLERGYVTGARGNTLVPYALPEGRCKVLGSCEDHAGGILYFLWNSAGTHRLVRFEVATITCTTLLEGPYLGLVESEPVLGATVLDGLLIYRDGAKQLRAVPMEPTARAQAVAALPSDPYALHLVHQPPRAAPTATRETNADPADARSRLNNVGGHAWQFALQYEYPSGERTPLGPYSALLPRKLNAIATTAEDTRNLIRVTLPTGFGAPSPLVTQVRLLCRADEETAWQVAATLSRTSAGTLPATFDFYGVTTGEALPASDAAKLSEALPVAVGCMTVARSRVLVGDCTEGYAPTPVAWNAFFRYGTAAEGGATSRTTTVFRIRSVYLYEGFDDDNQPAILPGVRTAYVAQADGYYPAPDSTYLSVELRNGQYFVVSPVVYSYEDAFIAPSADEDPLSPRSITPIPNATVVTAPEETADLETAEGTLHENTGYRVGVAFYDDLGRTNGASSVKDVLVPRQDYSAPTAQNVYWQFTTPTANQTAEIPRWATSYAILLSQNRTTRFFQQFRTDQLRQFRGDTSGGTPDLKPITESLNSGSTKEVWISLTTLRLSGRGYTFEAGDRLRFPERNSAADYPIMYQRGEYVAITPAALPLFLNAGPLALTPVVEIYRPVQPTEDPVLYERSPRYAIIAGANGQRTYATTAGVLPGDSYLFGTLETMSPSHDSADLWLDASRGRAIPVLSAAEQIRRYSLLRYSGVKVQGTKLMGLSVWDATAQDDLPQEQGAVVRLGVADQTQADGSLLLCVQERGAESRYLGQTAIQQADGQTTLALTKGVLGGGNALRGSYGLLPIHAATFFVQAGRAFWYCHERRELVRYAQNGLTPLALTYNFTTTFRAAVESFGATALTAGYDPRREEVWLSRPDRTTTVRSGRLVRTVTVPGKTLAWSEKRETWVDSYAAAPECLGLTGNTLASFRAGSCWLHSATAPYGSFFGAYTAPSLTFTSAAPGTKLWKNIALETEAKWLPTQLQVPRGAGALSMQSEVKPQWLAYLEGIHRAAFRRDSTSPGGLLAGRVLVGERLRVTLTAPEGQEGTPLVAASIGWVPRGGQL